MYNVCTNIESVYCLVNMSNVVQFSSIDALFMFVFRDFSRYSWK